MVNSGHRENLSQGDVNSVDTVTQWQIETRRDGRLVTGKMDI